MADRAHPPLDALIPSTVLDLSGDAFAIVDAGGTVVRINPGAERMFGYKHEEIAGHSVARLFDCFTPQILEPVACDPENQGDPNPVRRVRGRRRDGTLLPLEIRAAPVATRSGTLTVLCARIPSAAGPAPFEATERERVLEALRESENTLSAIINSTTAMIYIKDTESRYLLINRHFEAVFRVDNEDLRGKTDYDFLPREVADAVRENDRLVREAGRPVEFEEVVPHQDEEHIYISIKFPLRRASGEIYAVCGISTDITERKRAETELENTKQSLERLVDERTATLRDTNRRLQEEVAERAETASQLQRLLDTAREGIWVIDEAGCTTFANPRMGEILGYEPSEMIGSSMYEFMSEEFRQVAAMQIERRRQGIAEDHDFEFRRKDGSKAWTLLSTSPVYDKDGKVVGALAMVTDITERKNAEETQALLLQELDHRVKNSLATVVALSEMTIEGAESVAEFAQAFEGRIQAMARTHEALARAKWKAVPFETLVTLVLAPFRTGALSRISVNGSSGLIPPRAITPIALTLNELGTNALKHGALANGSGAVRLDWEFVPGDHFCWIWRETGGTPVTAQPSEGTGLQLIRGLINYELNGELSLDFSPTGLVCKVSIPMTETEET